MDTSNLDILNKATISFTYLHTNSTTHEVLLGAIAELVDNSRDANARNLYIDYDESREYLTLRDDGCGMTQKEAVSVISFGFSNKRNMVGMIGQYGNGLKSGAMRIGQDMILLTKKDGQLSCLLLSRTFHNEHNLQQVFVPSPCFNAEDRHMMCRTDADRERHRLEMSIIYKYSPFTDQDQLFTQFEKIQGESGTLIVLYTLRHLITGELELDFKSDPKDIKLTDQVVQREEEYNSLRAYLSVLYLNPRMKIYLRGAKVQTTRLTSTLIMKYEYQYLGKNLKACATKEHETCKVGVRDAEERLRVAQSDFGAYTSVEHSVSDKNERLQRRVLSGAVEEAKNALKICKERELVAKKAINSPTPLSIVFGLNVHHRNRYGCMFYNNGRMILAYQKAGVQKEKLDFMMECLGVVGIVDVPYSVLAPTHNKQSFENQREFQMLLKAMSELMSKYWQDIGIASGSPSAIKHFWKQYGYIKTDWNAEPIADAECQKNRYNKTEHWIQCDDCLKWRRVQVQNKYIAYGIPDNWKCADHPNSMHRQCSEAEEQERIKSGANKTEKQVEAVLPKLNGIKLETPRSVVDVEVEKERNGKRKAADPVIKTPVVEAKKVNGNDKRPKKTTSRYQEDSDETDVELDDEPVRKRGRQPIPKKQEKPPVVVNPPKRAQVNTPSNSRSAAPPSSSSSSVTSSSRMTGHAPTMRMKKAVVSSDDDEMPPIRKPRIVEPPAPAVKKAVPPISPRKVPAVVTKRSSESRGYRNSDLIDSPALSVTRDSRMAKPSTSNASTPTNGVKNGVAPIKLARESVSLDDQERRELLKLREEKKASFYVAREMLKQLAKKGCNEADKLLRLSDDKIRETIEPEKMINTFWEDKVIKPIRVAEQRSLNALEKRTDGREKIVEKTIEKEKIIVRDVIPDKYHKLAKSSIGIAKWLMPHYYADMKLDDDYDINNETVFEVMEKMSEVLLNASDNPAENDDPEVVT